MDKELRFRYNSMPDKEQIKIIITSAIMSILASLVSLLLSNEKNPWTKVKTFFAGTSAGILLQLIFLNFDFSQGWKNILSSTLAAFISTVWPLLGNFANKYIKKKGDELVSSDKPD